MVRVTLVRVIQLLRDGLRDEWCGAPGVVAFPWWELISSLDRVLARGRCRECLALVPCTSKEPVDASSC